MNIILSTIAALPYKKTMISVIFTGMIIIFLLIQISLQDIANHLANLSVSWILVGVLFYLIANVGRSVRLKLLIPNRRTQFRRLLPIVIAHSMFTNILPARTGELSLLFLLKKYETVSLDQSGVALLLARVADYVVVAFIFVAAAVASVGTFPTASRASAVIWAAIGLMLLVCVVVLTFTWWGMQFLKLSRMLVERFGLASHRLVIFGTENLAQIIEAFRAVQSPKRYLQVFGWSLFIWTATYAGIYAFLWGIGVETTFPVTVVGSTFAVLSKAVPFISVGGLGAHEAGWAVGFMLVGLDKTTAISSGFAVNILTILTSIVFGILSLWSLRVQASTASVDRFQVDAAVNRGPGLDE